LTEIGFDYSAGGGFDYSTAAASLAIGFSEGLTNCFGYSYFSGSLSSITLGFWLRAASTAL
jgi:hypothetical protein